MPPLADIFRARVVGAGAKTVVLGHGLGTDQSCWSQQVAALEHAGYRVVTFDFAGATAHTADVFVNGRYRSLEDFAGDLVALLQALDIHNATYVGHSMGGMAGLLAANSSDGLIDSLILLGSSACYVDEAESGYVGGFSRDNIEQMLQAMDQDFVAWVNGFAPVVVGTPGQQFGAEDFIRHMLGLRTDIATTILRGAFEGDHRQDVAQLSVPLWVLQTESDAAVPMAAARWLAEHGRARELIVIPSKGHLPHLTAPEAVSKALLHCLAAHEQR
ncbi:MAG: alpha/beta hydrolase [Hydrogenophaga sp.]|nr:alpha/beta hydrolase [Hydrogenophaga sp.]